MSLTHKNHRFITAGSILLMAAAAGFSYGYVHTSLFIENNAAATLSNVADRSDFFFASLAGWSLILLLDLIVSWGVCKIYQQEHPVTARLTAILRLVYTIVFGFAVAQLFEVPQLTAAHDAQAVYAAFTQFNEMWSLALIIFGLHLLTLAVPVWSDSKFSRIVSLLLALAGLAYLVVHTLMQFGNMQALASSIEQIAAPVMALGELVFAVFLFFRAKARDV